MTIEALIKAIPPPAKPTYAFTYPWEPIEAEIGTQLPPDYKDLIRVYGVGRFMESFDIYGPKHPTPERRLANAINSARSVFLQEVQGSLFYDDPPLPIWPRPGGLLACGETWHGDYLFWLTRGHVPEWPIVIWNRERRQLESFECDLTGFLAGIFEGTIEAESFPWVWDPDAGVPSFRSDPDPWPRGIPGG